MDYVFRPTLRLEAWQVGSRRRSMCGSHTMFTKGATGNITGLTWVTHTDPENAPQNLSTAPFTIAPGEGWHVLKTSIQV